MQINCIECGHKFDLGRNYDNYEGFVRCPTCAGLLDIRTEEGDVRAVRPASFNTGHHAPPPPATDRAPDPRRAAA